MQLSHTIILRSFQHTVQAHQKLAPVDFKREFGLLDKLSKADSRNFHGWNYCRFLARFIGVPVTISVITQHGIIVEGNLEKCSSSLEQGDSDGLENGNCCAP